MKVKILIAEDDEATLEMLRYFVGRLRPDDEIVTAADGAEAVRLARDSGPFDLALLDVMMPHADGEQVAAVIRGEFEHPTRFVFFTGVDPNGAQAERLAKLGVVVTKPCDMDVLGECINGALAPLCVNRD